jgi:hypothetical protein
MQHLRRRLSAVRTYLFRSIRLAKGLYVTTVPPSAFIFIYIYIYIYIYMP